MGIPKGAVNEHTSFSQKNFLVGSAPSKNQSEINNIFRNRPLDLGAHEQATKEATYANYVSKEQ